MFRDCESLTATPAFPTGTINVDGSRAAFSHMFYRCRSLLAGPEKLILKNCQNNVCNSMFYGCWALTGATEIAPEANNNVYAWLGYNSMFEHCHSLTTPPKWNFKDARYHDSMFKDCWSLTSVPDFSTLTSNQYTFSHMFQNCTSLSTVPVDLLPWTNLSSNASYESMFEGCTNLVKGPDLPATSIVSGCYKNMFKDCAKLTGLHYGAPQWD